MVILGQLVAGVAHEINNPIKFIYGNLSHVNEYVNTLLTLSQFYQQIDPESNLVQLVVNEGENQGAGVPPLARGYAPTPPWFYF